MSEEVLTIFRKYKNKSPPWYGDIVALFPELPGSQGYCLCYQHVGQHGDASYPYVISITKPATPEEYNDLKTELESIGYVLKIKQKWIRPQR